MPQAAIKMFFLNDPNWPAGEPPVVVVDGGVTYMQQPRACVNQFAKLGILLSIDELLRRILEDSLW